MKKKILALVLVLAMLFSCMMMLTSCPDDTGDDVPTNGEPNVDEGLNNGAGSSSVYPITDPNHPEAGAGTEDKYIH